jgi:hypothetical protein
MCEHRSTTRSLAADPRTWTPRAEGRGRRALAAVTCGALAVGLGACESTEDQSSKIGREGAHLIAEQGALRLGKANRDVRVSDVTVLSGGGRTAVAVRLTASREQANVPVLVDVTGAGGKRLYSNGTGGLDASLQRMPLLRRGQGAWWVDDQVLISQSAAAAHVQVGRGSSSSSTSEVSAVAVHLGEQSGTGVLSGELVNRSAKAQRKVPIFAVTMRGGRVTAAGRALIATLPGGSGARTRTTPFQIFLVGNPAGSSVQLTVAPTVT